MTEGGIVEGVPVLPPPQYNSSGAEASQREGGTGPSGGDSEMVGRQPTPLQQPQLVSFFGAPGTPPAAVVDATSDIPVCVGNPLVFAGVV